MKICLIDADSTIPNIALMKLATFHKKLGDSIEVVTAKLPYFPTKKKTPFYPPEGFDKYYCSVIFTGNKEYIIGDNIIFGGTGYSLEDCLPQEIENSELDYSIYPDNDISYGFISRGCIRKCSFCFVPRKEGHIRQVSTIDQIVKHKKVKFLDNNFLALPNHKELLKELVDKKIKCQFNQGLDIRLLDGESSLLLSQINHLGEHYFAFDDWSYLPIIEKQFKLLSWGRPYQFKFFVYCHPDMEIANIIKRVEWLKEHKCLPYIMRDIACWESDNSNFYVDLAAYCNQPNLVKKMTFTDYIYKRNKKVERAQKSEHLYYDNI